MHEHTTCEHELKYCPHCDVVYCEKCRKEWYSYRITNNTPYIYTVDSTKPYTVNLTGHIHGTPPTGGSNINKHGT